MRYYITVQEFTETVNSRGERAETWADKYSNIPASMRYLTTRELQEASARQSALSVAFETWATNVPQITAKDRILLDGDVYELDPPSYFGTQQEFVQIKAQKGLTDG